MYESHITIEPVFDERLQKFERLCRIFHFKAANLLMKKREKDSLERSMYDTFATGHSSDLDELKGYMKWLIITLKNHNYKVWRYKIEEIILDSKASDELNLLS